MKELFKKYREIIMYLIFGVLTTVVGFGTYFLIMTGAEHLLSIPMDNETSVSYITVYVIAQVIQWIAAVLFAFFTNRKWVFTEADRSKDTFWRQLVLFAGSRAPTASRSSVLHARRLSALISPSISLRPLSRSLATVTRSTIISLLR